MGTIYMKRAVITGPTGSIGIALINELEANGIEDLVLKELTE